MRKRSVKIQILNVCDFSLIFPVAAFFFLFDVTIFPSVKHKYSDKIPMELIAEIKT